MNMAPRKWKKSKLFCVHFFAPFFLSFRWCSRSISRNVALVVRFHCSCSFYYFNCWRFIFFRFEMESNGEREQSCKVNDATIPNWYERDTRSMQCKNSKKKKNVKKNEIPKLRNFLSNRTRVLTRIQNGRPRTATITSTIGLERSSASRMKNKIKMIENEQHEPKTGIYKSKTKLWLKNCLVECEC